MLGLAAKWKTDSWIAPAIVFSIASLLFSINLDRPPRPDELHHILAAQHLMETGRPLLAEGEYWRGILHTWLVAVSYEVFGEGLASARAPSVLLVALVAPILFLWVRREAGSLAAWLTAMLFISSPLTVEIAQFSRFYALQLLFFVFGASCVYYMLAAVMSIRRRVSLGILATVLLVLAVQQQVTSLMGLIAIAVWMLGVAVHQIFFSPAKNLGVKKGLVIALIGVGIVVILAVTPAEMLEWALGRYQHTSLFNADRQNEFWFYHLRFLILYPTFWPLVGLLALFALLGSPRLAWFAITVFSISFLLMSFAGPKATRYLSFAPPFLAIVWGVGLAYVVPPLWRYTEATKTRLIATIALPQRLATVAGATLIIVALSILVLMNTFWLRTATVIGNVALPLDTPTTDWRAAREALAPWTNDADIMITTEELGAIYFLGRADVRFSPSKFEEIPYDQRFEYGLDHRTGRPIITKPESLEKLIDCFERGIVVGPIEHWGKPLLISDAVQTVLHRHAKPIDVPESSHLYAWGWSHEPRETKPDYCLDLSRFSGRQVD